MISFQVSEKSRRQPVNAPLDSIPTERQRLQDGTLRAALRNCG